MTTPAIAQNLTASRVMKARRESICPICQLPIRPGMQIAKLGTWQHIGHVIERQRAGSKAAAS